MRLLLLDSNTSYELNEIPEEVDDLRFCVLDNSDPKTVEDINELLNKICDQFGSPKVKIPGVKNRFSMNN